MTKPRIAFPFMGTQVSGALMSVADTATRLIQDGTVVPVALLPKAGPATEVFENLGIEIVYHQDGGARSSLKGPTSSIAGKLRAAPTYFAVWRQAIQLLRPKRYDLVHINEDRAVLPWGLAARQKGLPIVWHVRQEKPSPLLDGIRVRLADELVFAADAVARTRFGAIVDLPPHRTIYNSVDTTRFSPVADKAKLRAELDLDPESPLLLFVGNLIRRKRPHWVLKAVADLQLRMRVQAVVVGAPLGDEDYQRELKRLAYAAPDPTRVLLLGPSRAVERYFRAADVVTLPSVPQGEAFPRVVIEAMATGAPVVATRVAGIPEAIDHGVTGILVDPEDYDGYVEALASLLCDEGKRARMSRAAVARVRERFSGDGISAELVSVYSRLIARMEQ